MGNRFRRDLSSGLALANHGSSRNGPILLLRVIGGTTHRAGCELGAWSEGEVPTSTR